ncbi:MAG: hypothetical protein QOJ06_3392 [Pseudonocardiales bacterium]|nr:hypothetical protein [Pseudonocardiales bacterium]
MTTRSFWLGIIGLRPDWPHRRRTGVPGAHPDSPSRRTVSHHEIRRDDGLRDLLADALIARHRARIPEAPELMLLRETWDGGWARVEADQLMAYIQAAMDDRMVRQEGHGQRILEGTAT